MGRNFWIGLAVLFCCATPAAAQHPLFADNSEVSITIEAPLTTLLRTARRNTDPHPGALILTGQGEPQRYNIVLSARGMSRRITNFCSFPPLRVDFENNQLRETFFRGQNELKLTTHCRGNANYTQLYVLEYTAYRLYNEISPMSYRVRPLRVTYRDTEGRRDQDTQFGFFVEDDDDVARRNNRVALDIETGVARSSQLDPDAAARVALFQYMIGNLDWDMVESAEGRDCCHNNRLLARAEGDMQALIPAPYDFDFSGFVSAPYALPPEGLSVQNVRTRLYRGYCMHNDRLPAAIAHFQSRREAINALIAGETRLSDERRATARRYIDGFYEVISDPERVQRQLVDRCRQSAG